MRDLASRLRNRVQLTTDGHRAYLSAVETAFGAGIDYAVLHKIYAAPQGLPAAQTVALGLPGTLSWVASVTPGEKADRRTYRTYVPRGPYDRSAWAGFGAPRGDTQNHRHRGPVRAGIPFGPRTRCW